MILTFNSFLRLVLELVLSGGEPGINSSRLLKSFNSSKDWKPNETGPEDLK